MIPLKGRTCLKSDAIQLSRNLCNRAYCGAGLAEVASSEFATLGSRSNSNHENKPASAACGDVAP